MKCVKNVLGASLTLKPGEVRRVSDEEAKRLVSTGAWKYCPKNDWRKAGKPKS